MNNHERNVQPVCSLHHDILSKTYSNMSYFSLIKINAFLCNSLVTEHVRLLRILLKLCKDKHAVWSPRTAYEWSGWEIRTRHEPESIIINHSEGIDNIHQNEHCVTPNTELTCDSGIMQRILCKIVNNNHSRRQAGRNVYLWCRKTTGIGSFIQQNVSCRHLSTEACQCQWCGVVCLKRPTTF